MAPSTIFQTPNSRIQITIHRMEDNLASNTLQTPNLINISIHCNSNLVHNNNSLQILVLDLFSIRPVRTRDYKKMVLISLSKQTEVKIQI